MTKFARFTTLSLIIALVLIPAGFAQTSRTTGALIGTVTDNTGSPLPGVTVTVTSPGLQGSRNAVTDAKGEYVLPLLPPGTYRAEFALQGIKSVVKDNVVVGLTQSTKVDAQMRMAVTETVTVTANSVVVDPTQTTTQQNFKEDHLKYAVVGSANRSYQNVLQQAAGVAGGSNPQVAGANNAQNNYMLDGINTTDPVTHTFGNNLAFDAIQEISIQTLGKDAEYSSSGGTVNVITKSGGNAFSGTADWRYNDTHFQSQGKATKPTGIPYFGGTPTGSALRFDKNLQPTKSSQPQATFGGPVMRDKLWFFAALARPNTAVTPTNVFGFQPGTRTFKGWNNLGKLTFTPLANQTLTGLFIDSYARIPFANQSSFFSPEADRLQLQGSRTYGLTYDAILNSKWLANVQVGHTPGRLASFPINSLTLPGVVDLNTGIQTVNYTNNQARTSHRDEFLANTTYYLEQFGTHAFKAGFDGNRTGFSSYNNAVGDPSQIPGYDPSFCSPAYGFPAGTQCAGYIELNPGTGAPQRINLSPINPAVTVNSKSYALFAQDEWNPITRLTLRLGVRWERVNWQNPLGPVPPSFKLAQPRVGAAYDVFNNASTVVHGFYGRVMDDNQLTLPSHGVLQPTGTDYFNLNPTTGKYTFDPNNSPGIFAVGDVYDPNLKPSYSNQASLGVTQKVWRNTSVDLTWERRMQHGLFEDYCGSIDASGNFHFLDQFQDNCVITNNPGFDVGAKNVLRSQYHGLITKIESRPYNWLDVVASWTHAQSKGTTESTQNAATDFDFFPSLFNNRYGFLTDDAKNRIKVDGYIRFPMDFTLGLNQYWDDGTPWSVFQTASRTSVTGVILPYGTYFIEPRGDRRLPHFSQTDLQLQKDFRFGNMKFGLIGSVFNIFNHETPTAINGNAGSRGVVDPNTGQLFIGSGTVTSGGQQVPYQQAGANRLAATFGQATRWQQPRRYEAGIRFEF